MRKLEKALALTDVYLLIPFKRDEEIFRLERNAIQRPIKINYDDYSIRRFNVPRGTTSVIMSDLIAGPLPEKLYWGLQTINSYTGSFESSSTTFGRNKLLKANLYINGKTADDFPITMSGKHACLPFVKFLENSNQQLNGFLSQTINMIEFANWNLLLSASIEPETGSLSFEFEFETELNADLVLITCGISEKTMRLDNNRNFQIT